MNESEQEQESSVESEPVEITDPILRSILRENQTLKTWVGGLVTGCEGCRGDATKWMESLGLTHEG